ncbi:hypothetical protein MRX96_051526 [Rhipicephalus microplus]
MQPMTMLSYGELRDRLQHSRPEKVGNSRAAPVNLEEKSRSPRDSRHCILNGHGENPLQNLSKKRAAPLASSNGNPRRYITRTRVGRFAEGRRPLSALRSGEVPS